MSTDGIWQLVVHSPMGTQEATADLRSEGSQLTGTFTNKANGISTDIFDGTIDGDTLRWKVKMVQIKMTLTFTTTVADDHMSGKVKAGMFGHFEVAGQRG